MSEQSIKSKSHIVELDGIRGIAVIMVVIWHYVTLQDAGAISRPMELLVGTTGLFWTGVDLFFVLSGFLIGGILLDNANRHGFYRAFYIRRAARILPVYGVLLALFFVCRSTLSPIRYGWLFSDAIPDVSYLTFTQNIFMGLKETYGGHFLSVTWSLAVEEQFYLAIPILLFFVRPPQFIPVVIVLIVTAPIFRFAWPGIHTSINTPFRMDSLLIGVLLAAMFRSEHFVRTLDIHRKTFQAVFVFSLFVLGIMAFVGADHQYLESTVIALVYAALITWVLLNRGRSVTAVLRWRVFTRAGLYSYGIYMYHQMVTGLLHGYFRGNAPTVTTAAGAAVTLGSLFATILLAFVSYRTFESYFLSIGRSYSYAGGDRPESTKRTDSFSTRSGADLRQPPAFLNKRKRRERR